MMPISVDALHYCANIPIYNSFLYMTHYCIRSPYILTNHKMNCSTPVLRGFKQYRSAQTILCKYVTFWGFDRSLGFLIRSWANLLNQSNKYGLLRSYVDFSARFPCTNQNKPSQLQLYIVEAYVLHHTLTPDRSSV